MAAVVTAASTEPLDPKARLLELDGSRASLEAELAALLEDLSSPGLNGEPAAGLTAPLCDPEGFPRPDVDVYATVRKRQRVNVLRTDLKALMVDMELALAALHGAAKAREAAAEEASVAAARGIVGLDPAAAPPPPQALPFARIDDVAHDGPAAEGGLASGDLVVRFGDVHAGNHRGLAAMAQVSVMTHFDRWT
jgi:26S proteasome non-ATPase regulatory subunit 9